MNIISTWNRRYCYNVAIGGCHLTRNKLWINNQRCRQWGRNVLYNSSIVIYWIIENILLWNSINVTFHIFNGINCLISKLNRILPIMLFILIKSFLMLLIVMLLIILCSSFIKIFIVFLILNIMMLLFFNFFIVSVLVFVRFIDHLQNRVESFRNLTWNRPSLNNQILCILVYYDFRLIESNTFFTFFLHIKLSSINQNLLKWNWLWFLVCILP